MNIDYDLLAHGMIGGGRSKDKTPPPPITNFKASTDQELKITLTWDNPNDTDFVGLRIQRKEGSYPTSITDGITVFNGSSSVYIDTIDEDVNYYYRAFTYDYDNNFNNSTTQQAIGLAIIPKIYGVAIADTNTNPETAVTYTNNALDMTGGSNLWDNVYPFNDIRPFLVKDGVEVVELNKNDFTKNISGGSVDITSGASGDVMIRFPKIWWKMYKEGGNQYVKYAEKQIDSTWKALSHINSRTGLECDYVYIGAYLGYSDGSKLRSLSGKSPTTDMSISTFRMQAQANGANYNQIGFYQITMLQILYLIRYKNLDSQTALGRGYTYGSEKLNTGNTNEKSMYFGESTGKFQIKFAGLEDFWGNCFYYIDGIRTDSNNNIQIATKDFKNDGLSATNYPSNSPNIKGFMSDIQGTTEIAFIIKSSGASTTTRYSDYARLTIDTFASFGGYYGSKKNAGGFQIDMWEDGEAKPIVSSRLVMFR